MLPFGGNSITIPRFTSLTVISGTVLGGLMAMTVPTAMAVAPEPAWRIAARNNPPRINAYPFVTGGVGIEDTTPSSPMLTVYPNAEKFRVADAQAIRAARSVYPEPAEQTGYRNAPEVTLNYDARHEASAVQVSYGIRDNEPAQSVADEVMTIEAP